jgi:hypothetical protein
MVRFHRLILSIPSGASFKKEEFENGQYQLAHGGWAQIVDSKGFLHIVNFITCDVLNNECKYEDGDADQFRYILSVKTPYSEFAKVYYCYSFNLESEDHIVYMVWAVDRNKKVVREIYFNTLQVSEIAEHPMTRDKKLIVRSWGQIPQGLEGNVYDANNKDAIGFH